MFIIGLVGFAARLRARRRRPEPAAMLFGARALQGAFAALMAPAALSLITVTFTEPRERAKAFGVYGGIAGGGAAIGLILGGVLTAVRLVAVDAARQRARSPSLAAVVGRRVVVRESRADGQHPLRHPRGHRRSRCGLVSLVYGFTKASHRRLGGRRSPWPASSPPSCCSAAFVVIERRTDRPAAAHAGVLDRNRGGSFLVSLLVGLAHVRHVPVPHLLLPGHPALLGAQDRVRLPAVLGAGIIVGAALASRLLPRVGPRPLMVVGHGARRRRLAWLTQIGVDTSFVAHVLPAEILMSLGHRASPSCR